jgi:RNA polymerase sigma factor (sigma-70 family)
MQTPGFRDLVRKAQEGDPQAVQCLFQAVLPWVEELVRARGVRAGDSVSEHAQNTCVRILTRLDQFRGAHEVEDDAQVVALFRAWVRLIMRTVILNSDRSNAVPQGIVSLQAALAGESTDGSAMGPPGREPTGSANVRAEERAQLIQEAIDALPDPVDRDILRRRFFEEQTLEAIAAAVGLNYDQVRYRSEKAMKRLQRRLEGLL